MLMGHISSDKQLKKSIKRIEKELQSLGLNAEVLRELLSGGPPEQDGTDAEHSGSPHNGTSLARSNGETSSSAASAGLKKSSSARSLSKGAAMPLSTKQVKRKNRRQARARAEYELAGKLCIVCVHISRAWSLIYF